MGKWKIVLIVAGIAAFYGAMVGLNWAVNQWRSQGGDGVITGNTAIGTPFALVNQDGQPVTEAVFTKKWTAVVFGATNGGLVTSNLRVANELRTKLRGRGQFYQVIFITVDPEQDTPTQLAAWLDQAEMSGSVMALTGSQAEIDKVTKAYRVQVSRAPMGLVVVNDPNMIYLMSPKGGFAGPYSASGDTQAVATQVYRRMRQTY